MGDNLGGCLLIELDGPAIDSFATQPIRSDESKTIGGSSNGLREQLDQGAVCGLPRSLFDTGNATRMT